MIAGALWHVWWRPITWWTDGNTLTGKPYCLSAPLALRGLAWSTSGRDGGDRPLKGGSMTEAVQGFERGLRDDCAIKLLCRPCKEYVDVADGVALWQALQDAREVKEKK